MRAYERQAYDMVDGRYTPMGEARLWDGLCERHVYERHAYEMTSVRGKPMRWPMRDARL